MSELAPAPGTIRYLCPLECGWHHDVPPSSPERVIELGIAADPAAGDIHEAISSLADRALDAEADLTETAIRGDLDTHTSLEFATVIHNLRVEVDQLRRERPVGIEETSA